MKLQTFKKFSAEDHATWKRLFERLNYSRQFQAHPLFTKGVAALRILNYRIDTFQETLFLLDSPAQLYQSPDRLVSLLGT